MITIIIQKTICEELSGKIFWSIYEIDTLVARVTGQFGANFLLIMFTILAISFVTHVLLFTWLIK